VLFRSKGTVNNAPVAIALEGSVLANRLVFGAYSLKAGAGVEVKGRLRGGWASQDGPQIRGCTDEQSKMVRELQAALEGGKQAVKP
jgi:hypothetical protein